MQQNFRSLAELEMSKSNWVIECDWQQRNRYCSLDASMDAASSMIVN
jgi:hypothetical protein